MCNKSFIVERAFDADRELVWKALTETERMKQWYIDMEEIKTIVGFTFGFSAGEEGSKQWKHLCEITEVVPEKKLTYSWKYQGYGGKCYVAFKLFEEDSGTKLKLTHSGIESFHADIPELAAPNFENG